jgi:CHAT domain-containing protein
VKLARAEMAIAQGDADEARRWADAAAQAHAQAGSADGAMRAALAHAQALVLAGDATSARAAFDTALTRARGGRRFAAEVQALTGLAVADQALGRHAAARAGFEQAVRQFEDLRQALPGDDVRSAFLADHLRPYRELLRYALQDHARSPGTASAARVLSEADRVRARTLSERLAGRTRRDADPDASSAALRARVSWLSRRVHGLEDDDDTPSDTLLEALHASERQLLEQVRRRRLTGTAAAIDLPMLDVTALCDALADDDALVEYVTLDDELLACVLRRQGVEVHRHLADWTAVRQAAEAAQFQLDALGHGAGAMNAHLPTLTTRCNGRLQQLHALVWAPLADTLRDARRLLLVAPGPLSGLPFAALNDGHVTLAEQHELAWMPSAVNAAASLTQGCGRPVPGRVLVLGESSRLPHAATEARAVARAFSGAELRLDAQATVHTMTTEAAGADLLHLACHAQFRGDSPSFSALQLHDGALTAEQVETLSLQARVVVLSACETAGRESGHALGGDEWVGLVRAFLLAGASCVVASHWPVDDRVTASFMSVFYRLLAAGDAPAAALRGAQLELRREHPHPFHWAAFALCGGL